MKFAEIHRLTPSAFVCFRVTKQKQPIRFCVLPSLANLQNRIPTLAIPVYLIS